MDSNGSTKFDSCMVSQEFKEVKDEKMEVSDILTEMCNSIGAKIEDNVDPLYFHETSSSAEKSLFDASKFEVKCEWTEENNEIKHEHECESTFLYCEEHLENVKFSVHSYSSIGGKTENNVDPLCCDESTSSTDKFLVDPTQLESKSECSEESIELKQQHESEGGFAYSRINFENIKSSVQDCNKSLKFDCHINYKDDGYDNSGQESSDMSSIMSQSINLLSSDTGSRAQNSTRDNFKAEGCSDIKQDNIERENQVFPLVVLLNNSKVSEERNQPSSLENISRRTRTKSEDNIRNLEGTTSKLSCGNLSKYKITENNGDNKISWRKFSGSSHLKQHALTKRNERYFDCTICGEKMTSKSKLNHMKIHTGERHFDCTICGKKFTQKGNLKTHLRIHSGEKPFDCTICGKKFSDERNLKPHMRIHTGERPFDCSVCGKKFIQEGHLRNHMRIHTGEKPFECAICGKKITQERNLKTHMRIHTGERHFDCTICGNKLTQEGNLKTHMRIHSGERPFDCMICGKQFRDERNLKHHLRIHTGERPFDCSMCGKKFIRKVNLRNHIRTHAGERYSD